RVAVAEHLAQDRGAALARVIEILENERPGPFGDHEAAALPVERTGRRRGRRVALGERLEQDEPGEPQVRQRRLAPAGDRRVRPSRPDEPVGLADRLAAGGAGGGGGGAGPRAI